MQYINNGALGNNIIIKHNILSYSATTCDEAYTGDNSI